MAIQKPTLLEEDIWARLAAEADKTKPTQTEINEGFAFGQKPTHQSHNWLFSVITEFLAHLNQMGIAQWDGTTEYITGSLAMDGNVLYQALKDNVNQKPSETVDNYWAEFKPSGDPRGGTEWTSDNCWYSLGDIVSHNGIAYVAVAKPYCTEPDPTESSPWKKIYDEDHNHDNRYPKGSWYISGGDTLEIDMN